MKIFHFLNPRTLLSLLLMFLVFVGLTPASLAENSSSDALISTDIAQREQLIYLARQFRERIAANEHDIKILINEKEWLEARILKMQDMGRAVPWHMHQSVGLKNKKIEATLNENERLRSLLRQDKYMHLNIRELDERANDLFAPEPSSNRSHGQDPVTSGYTYNSAASLSINKKAFQRDLQKKIKQADLAEWVRFTSEPSCCAIENVLPILFASGSATIPKEYKDFLKRLAALVKPYDVRIRINGFADTDNIRTKKYPSNFELGATRAANIVHELVKNGVNPSVFQIGSTGKYRHNAKRMSDKKLLERRADLKIIFISKVNMG